MTTKPTFTTQKSRIRKRFPVFPPRDDMQNFIHLHKRSIISSLIVHFGNSDTTLIGSEVPVAPSLSNRSDLRIPDLIVVFDCDVEDILDTNGYAIDEREKPPDFVLEVASRTTGKIDYTDKRRDYERYGIPEYWRFDDTGGRHYDTSLAGDRLVEGKYVPIEIEELGVGGELRGYSEVLKLYLCWEDGLLRFYDPVEHGYLLTHFETEDLLEVERERAYMEHARANAEAEARRAAEAEIRRLREQLEDIRRD